MIYNLLLYMGIFFIVGGFCLFLYSEMKIRDIDIQLFKLEQKILARQEYERKYGHKYNNFCNYLLCKKA